MASTKNAGSRLSGILVLVFDADKAARDRLKANLEVCGAIVSVARSPGELLAILAQFSPHVIVADLSTAGEDWYGLLNEARNLLPEGRKISAIALTPDTPGDNRAQTLEAAFQAFVQKPIELNDLCDAITSAACERGKSPS